MSVAQMKRVKTSAAVIAIIFLAAALTGVAVYAHGGKSHGGGNGFTNLDALKKATDLYDKLVASEKIDVDWETNVDRVQIAEHRKAAEIEKVVSFSRSGGDPRTVYIFFKASGEYAGSNFTGQ